MNYLLLSFGGTGSTILQRLITMTYHLENIKIINTNDIITKFLELDENNNIKRNSKIQYGQTLQEIQTVLEKSNKDTALVSRVSKNHVDARQDNKQDLLNFYMFTKQFYGKHIFCERENVFELAMSLAIKEKSGVYNVFDDSHRKIASEVSEVDERCFVETLDRYLDYRAWIADNFARADMVSYEDVITNTDDVLSNITGYKDTLKKHFGLPMSTILRLEYKNKNLSNNEANILALYKGLCATLIQNGTLREVPIKNSSLQDKKNRIRNFDRCLKIFYQHTRKFDFIDPSKATYDFWNQKEVDKLIR
tara:strand:- start:39 stop:959 length:921 start_codon:yes stop_codon:yes gene_type:complete